jgi:hypothetical protein
MKVVLILLNAGSKTYLSYDTYESGFGSVSDEALGTSTQGETKIAS